MIGAVWVCTQFFVAQPVTPTTAIAVVAIHRPNLKFIIALSSRRPVWFLATRQAEIFFLIILLVASVEPNVVSLSIYLITRDLDIEAHALLGIYTM
jgi:hypothetical protein